jgi:hypothetical protein
MRSRLYTLRKTCFYVVCSSIVSQNYECEIWIHGNKRQQNKFRKLFHNSMWLPNMNFRIGTCVSLNEMALWIDLISFCYQTRSKEEDSRTKGLLVPDTYAAAAPLLEFVGGGFLCYVQLRRSVIDEGTRY